MEFEWDEAKRRSNLRKHGLDFADMSGFDWDTAALREDDAVEHEQRGFGLGFLDGRLVAIVYTLRGERCRMISMRSATRQEYRRYGRS